ncbi:MAG: hypothetical protein HZC17_00100 [Candidatus Omnitrophica bacterium]|nr:hypothetical protein [Candidatus Omnitrophota bacterium]
MFIEEILDVQDKSFYADKLQELIGISRGKWGRFSASVLRDLYEIALREKAEQDND